ncbi:MAG: hypothetical protein NUV46_00690 [Nanoarchaeota archaeon]|nr:hypothetical protein [Nanoarchaeota archaeon]
MPQNRKKFIELIIGNLSNAIVHEVLREASENNENIAYYYEKEVDNAIKVSSRYREKINPSMKKFPEKDVLYMKNKIIQKAKSELNIRILKGYTGIDLSLIEGLAIDSLKSLNIL